MSSQVQRYNNTVTVRVIVQHTHGDFETKLVQESIFTLITAILNFYLEQTSNYISNFLTFIVIVITFYLPSYLGQKTAK